MTIDVLAVLNSVAGELAAKASAGEGPQFFDMIPWRGDIDGAGPRPTIIVSLYYDGTEFTKARVYFNNTEGTNYEMPVMFDGTQFKGR